LGKSVVEVVCRHLAGGAGRPRITEVGMTDPCLDQDSSHVSVVRLQSLMWHAPSV